MNTRPDLRFRVRVYANERGLGQFQHRPCIVRGDALFPPYHHKERVVIVRTVTILNSAASVKIPSGSTSHIIRARRKIRQWKRIRPLVA